MSTVDGSRVACMGDRGVDTATWGRWSEQHQGDELIYSLAADWSNFSYFSMGFRRSTRSGLEEYTVFSLQ